MIEIAEAHVFSKQIRDLLLNKVVQAVIVNKQPHKFAFHSGDINTYQDLLNNKKITDCQPNGGQIEIFLEDIRLLLTDGAKIRYYPNEEELPNMHQLLVHFTDQTYLVVTIRMYGGIMVFKEGTYDWEYYIVPKTKPNVLSDDFNINYFKKLIFSVKDTLSVKALLATEQRIPGLGNGCLQDILYDAHINPRTKVGLLTNTEVEGLYWSIKNVLSDMIYKGGRDTEKDLLNEEGGYKTYLSSKTYNRPCFNCGTMIVKENFLGGTVYYCPICQQIKK